MSDVGEALSGYTKLWNTIIHSTVWREDLHVKVVWITMLAMADQNGSVQASVPGLADAARVSIDQCQDALKRLSAPDEYSRTKDCDGRRVEVCEGGWTLLNHKKYRDLQSRTHRQEQVRIAVAKHRAKDVSNGNRGNHTVSAGKPKQKQKQKDLDRSSEADDLTPAADAAGEGETPRKKSERLTRQVLAVVSHYRTYHPRTLPKPNAKSLEWRRIRDRLTEGRTVEELSAAIDGCHLTPHNLGENERRTKYLGLDLIMRDDAQVQRFIENAEQQPGKCRVPTDEELAAWRP